MVIPDEIQAISAAQVRRGDDRQSILKSQSSVNVLTVRSGNPIAACFHTAGEFTVGQWPEMAERWQKNKRS